MEKIKVTNMDSPRTGCKVANQYVIKIGNKMYFQSYNTVVSCIIGCGRSGEVKLIKGATDFSKTTSRYLYRFLGENSLIYHEFLNKRGIQELVNRGEIKEVESF